jgi:hypothetical protein
MAEPDIEGLRGSRRVRIWLDEVHRQQGDSPQEDERRLAVLARFCAFVERTADQMIDDVLDFDAGKMRLKGRRFYADKIEEFEKAQAGDAFAQRAAANLVRSFFIHNGLFLGTPKAPWLP